MCQKNEKAPDGKGWVLCSMNNKVFMEKKKRKELEQASKVKSCENNKNNENLELDPAEIELL